MLQGCPCTPVSWNRRVLAEIVGRHRNGLAAAPDSQSRGLGNQVEGEKGGNIKGEVQAAHCYLSQFMPFLHISNLIFLVKHICQLNLNVA
jgi:hypothetical protein